MAALSRICSCRGRIKISWKCTQFARILIDTNRTTMLHDDDHHMITEFGLFVTLVEGTLPAKDLLPGDTRRGSSDTIVGHDDRLSTLDTRSQ